MTYVAGSFWRIDDRTGFKRRSYNTQKEWNGLIVDRRVWEPRHPQDFVKGVIDDQTVPQPRPRSPDVYMQLGTQGSRFEVYGDNPLFQSFLVQNSMGYDIGINAESNYTNPNGTGQFTVYQGTAPPIFPFPPAGGTTGTSPTNLTAPSIGGATTVGLTLFVFAGVWTGFPTPTLTYQWLSNGANIVGATGLTYLLAAGDAGAMISVREFATNSAGTAYATSAQVGPVVVGAAQSEPFPIIF